MRTPLFARQASTPWWVRGKRHQCRTTATNQTRGKAGNRQSPMKKFSLRTALKRGQRCLLALGAMAGTLITGPAAAQSFYENDRSYYFGMGDLRTAGGMVDIPTGAVRLGINLPPIFGRSISHPIAWYFTSQDASDGPLGKGTSLSAHAFFVDTGSGLDLILPGHRRFRFTLQYDPMDGGYVYKDSRDPEMLGAVFNPQGGYLTGWLTFKNGSGMYFQDGMMTEIGDRHGNSLFLEVQTPSYRVVAIRGATTYPRVDFVYDGFGRLSTIFYQYGSGDPNNRSWTFAYDGSGRVSTMTGPGSRVTTLNWTTYTRSDGQVLPLLTSITRPRGNSPFSLQYNGSGRVSSITNTVDGGVTTLSYSSAIGQGGTTTLTDPRNNVTSWSYTWPTPLVGSIKYGYRLTHTTDAMGRTTTYQALQTGSQLITRITDFRNRVTTLGWDHSKGNLTSVTRPTAAGQTAVWTYTYEPNFNQINSMTDPLNRTTSLTLNGLGDVTAVTDPRNNTTSFGRNGFGEMTSVTNALNQTTTFTRGSFGEVLTVTDPQNHQTVFTYDSAQRPTQVRDANLKTVQTAYNARDEVTSITQTLNGNPLVTTFGYDLNSNRTSMTDARSKNWTWVVDNLDRVTQAKNPLNQAVSLTYDLNSNVLSRTDPLGQKWEFAYGTGDRLSGMTFRRADNSIESTISLTYDATTELLSSLTDSLFGTTSWSYDSIDRVISQSGPHGTLTFTLDNLGRRTALQVPNQGLISYGFDNNDNITSISQDSKTTTFAFDALNRMTLQTLPTVPAVTVERTFDTAGFMTALVSKRNGVAFDSHSYVRDNVGNITQKTSNGQVSAYGYDDLYRLISASMGGVSSSWTYDAVGNRLSQTVGGVTTTYTHNDANRLLTVNGAAVTHDLNGNLTAFGSDTFTWDVRGRLKSFSRPGLTHQFTYDQNGLRTGKNVNGTLTSYLLDGASVVSEITGAVRKHTLQSPFLDQPLARDGKWFTPDHLGGTSKLVDGSGNTVQGYAYQPFGQTTGTPSPGDSNPFRFTGREDEGTGLYYYRRRYYAPEWGRFLSEDPLGSGASSPYAYAANNPITGIDPYGLAVIEYSAGLCIEPYTTPEGYTSQNVFACGPGGVRLGPNAASTGGSTGEDWVTNAGGFFTGWADPLTLGGIGYVQEWLGIRSYVDPGSGYYFAGGVVGDIHSRLLRRPSLGTTTLRFAKKADIRQIDRIVRKYGLTPDEREELHNIMEELKGRGQTLPHRTIEELAREILENRRR